MNGQERIPVSCQCGQRFAAKAVLAGRTVKCPKCGVPLKIPPQSRQLCPECQAEMPSDAVLCVHCGYHRKLGRRIHAEVKRSEQPPVGGSETVDRPGRGSANVLQWVTAVAIVVLAVLASVVGFCVAGACKLPPVEVAAGVAILTLFAGAAARRYVFAGGARRRLSPARRALQEGRLGDASRAFKEVARLQGAGMRELEEAVDGLTEVYRRSGKEVDLGPIRQLRREFVELEAHLWQVGSWEWLPLMREWKGYRRSKQSLADAREIQEELRRAILSLPDVG